MRLPERLVWAFDRHVVSRTFTLPPRLGRVLVEALASLDPVPGDVEVRHGLAAGSKTTIVAPKGAPETPRTTWIHGGGFSINSPRVYEAFAAHLGQALGSGVVMPSYRLTPEHPFPAGLEDALAAYRAIAAEAGQQLLAGDSAGANLALNIAIALRDSGDEPPIGLYLMSPWVDLTRAGDSVRANDGKDAILRARDTARKARIYAPDAELADPRISPLFADLAGLPPTLIQCGSKELFYSECAALAERMESAGVPVALDVIEGGWHDYPLHAGMLPKAAAAVDRVAAWARPLLG